MKKLNVDILVYSFVLSILMGLLSGIMIVIVKNNNASIAQSIADKNSTINLIVNGEIPSLTSEKVKLCNRNQLVDKLVTQQSHLQPIADNQRVVLKAESPTHDQVSQQR